jgi:cell division protein FtsW (lipid II flippase)
MAREGTRLRRLRTELGLIELAGALTLVGFALVSLSLDSPMVRLVRVLGLVGGFVSAHLVLNRLAPRRDPYVLPLVTVLCGIGTTLLWRLALEGGRFATLFEKQFLWVWLGLLAMALLSYGLPDVRRLQQVKYLCGVTAVLLLIVTMLFGKEAGGARLWLDLGFVSFQPAEIAKPLMAIFLAGYVASHASLMRLDGPRFLGIPHPEIRHVGPLLLLVLLSIGVFIFQRDLGAAMLFFGLFLAMIYLATSRRRYVVAGVLLFVVCAALAYQFYPHVRTRFSVWLDPFADYDRGGFQVAQALFALGNGDVFGVGLGQGVPALIPVAESDLVFAVLGEELGLIGATGVICLFALLVFRAYQIAMAAEEGFPQLLAAAIATIFALQAFVIIGGVVKLIPLTGITLPFISYGGTSIVTNFVLVGLLLRVSDGGVRKP